MRRSTRAALAAAALVPLAAFAQSRAPANDSIHKEELKADLYYLASDAMRGRLTGTPEYYLAAGFVESRFERLGLKPLARQGAPPAGASWFQPFSLVVSRLGSGNRLDVIAADQPVIESKLGEGYYPLIFSADGRVRAEIAFAGFGILAPALDWDDWKSDLLRGRLVLVLDGDPGASDPASVFDGLVNSEYSVALRKTLWAQEKGAAGILFVNARQQDQGQNRFAVASRSYWPEKPPRVERYTLASLADKVRIPAAQVSPAIARLLLAGADLAELARQAERPGGVTPLAVASRAELRVSLNRHVVEDRNVIAMIEGSDPRRKDEAVLISAHYDHNGADGDQVFNGADDNGSGTVALLEIAEAYALAARQGARPARSVLFAAWGSEERCCGPLLGAWAWAEHPLWPLEKTVAVLNMDMLGRSEEVPEGGGSRFNGLKIQTALSNANSVNILGYSFSPDMAEGARAANRETDLLLRFRYDNNRSQLLRRSDHWVFLQRGVPALWFHTGLHPDYHTIYDRPEKIDYGKIERIARLVHQLSWNLAQQEGRPRMPARRVIPEPD